MYEVRGSRYEVEYFKLTTSNSGEAPCKGSKIVFIALREGVALGARRASPYNRACGANH